MKMQGMSVLFPLSDACTTSPQLEGCPLVVRKDANIKLDLMKRNLKHQFQPPYHFKLLNT